MLWLWLATFLGEALLFTLFWRWRRVFSILIILFIILATSLFMQELGRWFNTALAFLTVYRVGNLLRIVRGRMHQYYMRQAVSQTSFVLFVLHSGVIAGLVVPLITVSERFWLSIAIIQLIVAAGLFMITVKTLHKLHFKMPTEFLADNELPTVTVAIPARNETTDLEECLRSVLANDYPKLEIIVLDDCSQGKTADIIRSFAHDGVRFVQGKEPAERWLAKNQAYQKLYEEASGDLVLFCGVDARFGPQAIRSMVNLLFARKKSMLSVLPTRANSSPASAFIQPMRYWWELSLPRKLFKRPAVLSTCWMISRDELKRLGGFGAVSHTVIPEGYFAREEIKNDGYSFVRSSNELQVGTAKIFFEQYQTALRTQYPQIRRRPEMALMMTIACLFLLLGPFALLVASFWYQPVSLVIPAFAAILLLATHAAITLATDPANTLLAILSYPFVVIVEVIVGHLSMIRYEFFKVEWKDRNICIPVMHVIPKLPKLPDS